ncbi:hypothetical protein DMJ13_22950 [halophilic archaeon]|nr:hypothetical protein DMJ13_22950 [halophilic archaeon]
MSRDSQPLTTYSGQGNSFQTYLLAIGIFICSAGFLTLIKAWDLSGISQVLRLEYFGVGLILASIALAFRDQGMKRAWIFVFAFGAGFGIHLVGMGITGEMPGLPFRVLWAGVVGAVTAAILGTLGGAIGIGLRRLIVRQESGQ